MNGEGTEPTGAAGGPEGPWTPPPIPPTIPNPVSSPFTEPAEADLPAFSDLDSEVRQADDWLKEFDALPVADSSGGAAATASVDPWAHRRGEPRLFAFLWTCYVMLAVAGSLHWLARSTYISPSTYGPAARIMLVVVAAGATILWPMVRLSQVSPRRPLGPIGVALLDMVVVLAPIQMVLWPLVFLANWPLDSVGALSLLFAAWVALIGAVVALGTNDRADAPTSPSLGQRSIWMGACLMLVGVGPLVIGVLHSRHAAPAWVHLLSPFTAIPKLTGYGFSGPTAPVGRGQWVVLVGTAFVAVVMWAWAMVRSPRGKSG